jgi:hypothetical protein
MRVRLSLVFVVLVADGCASRRIAEREAHYYAARADDGSPLWEQHTLYAGTPYYLHYGWEATRLPPAATHANPVSLRAPEGGPAEPAPSATEGLAPVAPAGVQPPATP